MRRPLGDSLLGSVVSVAVLCVAERAHAQPTLSVRIELAACTASDARGIARVVQAELGSSIAVSTDLPASALETPSSELTRVRVTCSDEVTELQVQDPVTGKRLSRRLRIPPELAAARSRMLGLSIAELVAASWIELRGTRTSEAKVVEATAPRETRAAALEAAEHGLGTRRPHYELCALASARHWTRDDFTSFGGALAFSWLLESWLALVLDADAATGSHSVSLGQVNALLGSLALGPRVRYAAGRWSFMAGAGMRVGLVHFAGVANRELVPPPEQRAQTLPWAGPLLAFSAGRRLAGPVSLSAALEAGLVSYRAEARVAGRGEFEIAGPWLGLGLGLGFSGLD
jgi:hypothetical protein